MSIVSSAFLERFGKPSKKEPSDLQFQYDLTEEFWKQTEAEIGAGWYMDGFLYLFGHGLQALRPCIDAWSFVAPPTKDRIILGRNAYGSILVLENEAAGLTSQRVYVLDPLHVQYWTDPNITITNLIGNFLPNDQLTERFLDDTLFRKWRKAEGIRSVDIEDILAPKTPLSLGGDFEIENFQLERAAEYYQSTAPIYRKAFAKNKSGKAKR